MTTGRSATSRVHAAYETWAECYPPAPHNPLMRIEQQMMSEQLPDTRNMRALDLACGSGRYTNLLTAAGACVVATDFSRAMLRRVSVPKLVLAEMTRLPFRDSSFDLVVSGLAIGHANDLVACMKEIARVLRPGGTLLYSDFHPSAAKAGLRRSGNVKGSTCEVPKDGYELEEHRSALAAARLAIDVVTEARVGIELREQFDGSADFYSSWHGLPLVLIVKAHA